jgi:hypothetical protein
MEPISHPAPPSPFAAAGGLIWLPRLLAKARRAQADGLGEYLLFEDSPLDAMALAAWRVRGAALTAWLAEGLDDGAIAARVGEAMGAADEAARAAWSRSFARRWGWFFRAIDADEGRLPPGLEASALRAMLAVTYRTVLVGLALRGRRR